MTFEEFAEHTGIERAELERFIAAGWVMPGDAEGAPTFVEIDVARVRFVSELRGDLGLEDDAIEVVLSLLDQVYTLRHDLRGILSALREEDEAIRRRVLRRISADLS